MKSLGQILTAAVGGALPAADGLVVVVAAPKGARAAIVAFTGHHVVAAAVDPEWVARLCPARALEAPFGPAFVTALGERLGAEPGTLDVVLVAAGAPVGGAPDAAADPHADLVLRPATAAEHREALADAPNPRLDARVWFTPDGVGRLVLGRGLEGRWEAAIGVAAAARGQGLGRRLAAAARGMTGPNEPIYAQIAPGNVASLRAALAAGYRPIAAEILFFD